MKFDPHFNKVGGFSENDGTIDYYSRINCLIDPNSVVLDYGAGRGQFIEDKCQYRRELRNLKGKVKYLVGCDIDQQILSNQTLDERILITNKKVPLPDASFNLINADYVLEHIEKPLEFASEINRLLKPGGWFTARTPHKYCYVSIFSKLFPNKFHPKILKTIQPYRKSIDVFPTSYRLNTLREIKKIFPNYENKSFIFRGEPSYYFNNKLIYKFEKTISRLFFDQFVGNLFIFLKKT